MITVTFLEYRYTFTLAQQKHVLKYNVTYLMRVLIGDSNLLRCYQMSLPFKSFDFHHWSEGQQNHSPELQQVRMQAPQKVE